MINTLDVESLLISLGYDKNSIDKIIDWYKGCLEKTVYNYIINMFDYLKSKGYSEVDIVKMTKLLPQLFALSKENIENKVNYLKSKGYSDSNIVKMTKILPQLFGLNNENIESKFNYLQNKGYSNYDIVKMTKQFPQLFSLSDNNIEEKLEFLKSKGYSEHNIVKMTKILPQLFSLSSENIDKKIEFYREIELEDIIIHDTMQLMQSVELTYARYRFLSDLGIIINEENYYKMFSKQKYFIQKYGITNDELLNKYPYNQKIIKKV